MNHNYDLVVIGSGPAGEKGAAQAAYFGKRVALVEKSELLGGAAANTGTLPSKTLRESAVYLSGFRHRKLEGMDFQLKRELTVSNFLARKQIVSRYERQRIAENLKRHKVDVYHGSARFLDASTVAVSRADGEVVTLAAEHILIATGSSPNRPAQFDFNHPQVYDSDTILELKTLPSSVMVVGGGVIGCEYACMLAELGIRITLVEQRSGLVGCLDLEVAGVLESCMKKMGMTICVGDSVKEVGYENSQVHIRLQSGQSHAVDAVLVSAGRCGNSRNMGLDEIGVSLDPRGRILVNENYQTSVPHIYAAGDVIGAPALASTSMQQARLAMVHAFQLEYLKSLPRVLPYGIYTIPECSLAGDTEEDLQKKGIDYVAGKALYAANARGQIIGDQDGFLKLLFRTSDMQLLGVHVIGEQATELVHTGLTALLMGANAQLFIETCYNYPTLTELYKYAAYDALGARAARQRKL